MSTPMLSFHAKGGGGHMVKSCLFVISTVSELIGNSNSKQVILPG